VKRFTSIAICIVSGCFSSSVRNPNAFAQTAAQQAQIESQQETLQQAQNDAQRIQAEPAAAEHSALQDTKQNPEIGQSQVNNDGSTTLKLDGLDMEFDKDGNWSKIYSTYTQPVEFPDRQGIKTAQIIAEEKGKAQIVRFMNETVESDRLVEEVDKTVQRAQRTQGTGAGDKLTKENQREMAVSVREFTHSYSSGNLRGVTVLDMGYNDKAEEVWVKIGISRATTATADVLKHAISGGGGASSMSTNRDPSTGAVISQPSEIRPTRDLP
jgi:hypothetical protein